jgi:hypothetical protein
VERAAIDRAHHPQHPIFRIQIDPLECQLLRPNAADCHQPDSFADWILQTLDQLIELIPGRELLSFFNLLRREIGTKCGI